MVSTWQLKILLLASAWILSGCQVSYLLRNSWHQTKILKSRTPIQSVLENPDVSEEVKEKLRLVLQAREFATKEIGLKKTESYSTYVDLNRNYVTWIVQASPKNTIEAYRWWFPITGHVPYKGYFSQKEADHEAHSLRKKNLDTYVRGVTAYSTLGWFDDPVLNTMIRYNDYDLVSLIIHELVHSTLFIKSQADFNERLATFIGYKGAEMFFQKALPRADLLDLAKRESSDLKVFSKFITEEVASLKSWYQQNPASDREPRLREIQTRFQEQVLPNLQTDAYKKFAQLELNNAVLLSFSTYQENYDLFEKAFEYFEQDIRRFLEFCKSLEDEKDPEASIRALLGLS